MRKLYLEKILTGDDLDKEIELFVKESEINPLILTSEKDRSNIISQYIINF